jgi:hypothetical protein
VFLGEREFKNRFTTQKIVPLVFSSHYSGGQNLDCNPVDDVSFATVGNISSCTFVKNDKGRTSHSPLKREKNMAQACRLVVGASA